MSQEVLNRINRILKAGATGDSNVSHADLDELKILHSRTRDFFPMEFNKLLDSTNYETVTSQRRTQFQRLQRILDTLASLPEDIRVLPLKPDVDSTSLIPKFELGRADKARIFELCTDMRKIVFASQDFDEPHRLRLLNRIAAIEAETHKPKGMFDVVRGGMSDLGETHGKFGKDVKPLTDRMCEVVGIARKGTKEYDQLPAPEEIKHLPAPSEDESENS